MKPEFVSYLVSIGMESNLIELVEKKYIIMESLKGLIRDHEIKDLFIEETLEDGKRKYIAVVIFLDKYLMDSKIFSPNDEVMIQPLNKNILRVQINSINYNRTEAANINSQLSISFTFESGTIGWTLSASRENCDKLKKVIDTFIFPNLKMS
jgi:hypothetical protein